MIYSYLFQNTSPVTYSEDTHGDRCTSSNGPSSRVSFGNEYRQKAEVFKGNEFRNKGGYLKLKNIQKEDAGKYLCLVKSNLLHKHVTFQLFVKGIQDQDADTSVFYFSVLPYLLSSLLLELCFVKITGRHQKEKEELQNCEVDYLDEETCQWQINKEELQKLHREINNLNEEKYQWQINKEEFQKLHKEVEWRRACSNADSITLDADSAHPNIFIAVDNKSFTYKAQDVSFSPNPQRFDGIVSVLGSEGFSSGNHYWTVETGGSTEWDLGVARRSIQRKGQILLSPKEGFWVLGRSGKDYWAKTKPWTRIIVQRKLSKIGVYLSFQQKEVTFFNIVDMSVVFKFRDCAFSEEIFPFFKNKDQGTTVKLCTVKEEKA
ncbi:butyrophilin subfamily 2 member A2-like [Sphaerodactylus townsendi]|uniref:butyrophilin subfamily 2 member A2-like n=1 Tax=Sphaerodactylus townsendi TaxID=933632 RepID=UPI002025C1B2|nr:butyrophilin subfamily 2 member A2-like [Sphaerodactylus townsendi]